MTIEPHTSPTPCNDELNWLAFQYVAGELSESDRENFEHRMIDDLSACEAVAAMANLTVNLQVAAEQTKTAGGNIPVQPVTVATTPFSPAPALTGSLPGRVRSLMAVVATMAALAWLVMLLQQTEIETPEVQGVTVSPAEDAASLISKWSGSEDSLNTEDESFDDMLPLESMELDSPKIPRWMIAAVSLENAKMQMDEEMADVPSEMNSTEMKEN